MKIIIFSTKERRIGELIYIKSKHSDLTRVGRVVRLLEDDPKYKDQNVHGAGLVNTGKNYYEVEL
jgi:hypothetical protein